MKHVMKQNKFTPIIGKCITLINYSHIVVTPETHLKYIVNQLLNEQFGVKQDENDFKNDHEAACILAEFFIKKGNDISNNFTSQSVFDSGSDALVNDVTGNGVLSHELGGSAHVVPVFSTFEKLSCSDLKSDRQYEQ